MKRRWLLVALVETQRSAAPWDAQLDPFRRPVCGAGDAERLERLEEERFARCVVADAELT